MNNPRYPARLAVSEDDGGSWSELKPAGDWGGIVVMGCVEKLSTPGHYLAMFHDDGRTWSEPQAMPGVFSVQPSLAVFPDGMVALSGGRPGLFLWLNRDGRGESWDKIDLPANHNAHVATEPIRDPGRTSAYTEVVVLDDRHLLSIYDRIPNGWSAIPADSTETNSVWVVRVTLKKGR